jgi:hypothetical protein
VLVQVSANLDKLSPSVVQDVIVIEKGLVKVRSFSREEYALYVLDILCRCGVILYDRINDFAKATARLASVA